MTSVEKIVNVTRKEGCLAVDPFDENIKKATCICPECTCTAVKAEDGKTFRCARCKKTFSIEEAVEED